MNKVYLKWMMKKKDTILYMYVYIYWLIVGLQCWKNKSDEEMFFFRVK